MENATINLLGVLSKAIFEHESNKIPIRLEYYIRQKVTEFISDKFMECFRTQNGDLTYECIIKLLEDIIR